VEAIRLSSRTLRHRPINIHGHEQVSCSSYFFSNYALIRAMSSVGAASCVRQSVPEEASSQSGREANLNILRLYSTVANQLGVLPATARLFFGPVSGGNYC
jgi:hypothetical protein